MFTKTKAILSVVALSLAGIIVANTIIPNEVDANYASNNQIQTVDGYNICHLRDDGWCGITQFDGDNVNFEACAGLKVHCNKTAVDYTMYSHSAQVTNGTVTIKRANASSDLGAIKMDETKSFDIKTIINQINIANDKGIYTLSLKVDMYKTPVSILLYYDGDKIQTCWQTSYDQHDIDRWNEVVGNLDPNTCLDMYVGNKSVPITYPTSGTDGACNHVQEWCDLSDEIVKNPEWSNEMKVYSLVMYLTRNYAYDDYRVNMCNNTSRAMKKGVWNDDNLFMYYNKVGQCWDFANVMTIMCRHHGISCTSVENEGHTVNAIWMNGEWIAVDVSALVANHCDTEDTAASNWKHYRTSTYEQCYGYYDGSMDTYNQALATPETTLSNKSGKNPM